MIMKYQGAEVRIEEKPEFSSYRDLKRPSFDAYQWLVNDTAPQKGTIKHSSLDEKTYFRTQSISATTAFENNRKKVENSLIKIVSFLWDHYNLSRSSVIEYCRGSIGYFDSVLRPKDIENWLQVEINPKAIIENQRRNPNGKIMEGSYNNIQFRNVPMITGLSSFDGTKNLPHAIDQVAKALQDGGTFLHIEDVRPGAGCTSSYIAKKYGVTPEYAFFTPNEELIGFLINNNRITLTDIFREAIGDAIINHPDLELILNHYVTLSEKLNLNGLEKYFLNFFLLAKSSEQRSDTTVIATIARKKLKNNRPEHD